MQVTMSYNELRLYRKFKRQYLDKRSKSSRHISQGMRNTSKPIGRPKTAKTWKRINILDEMFKLNMTPRNICRYFDKKYQQHIPMSTVYYYRSKYLSGDWNKLLKSNPYNYHKVLNRGSNVKLKMS